MGGSAPCLGSHANKKSSWGLKQGFVAAEVVLFTTPLAINSNSILMPAIVGSQRSVYHILTLSFSHGQMECIITKDKLLFSLGHKLHL